MAINRIKGGAVVISASGMADAGRIKHHLKHNLWRPESTILFIGYQAQGTLGRRILDGEKKVRIHGEEVAVKADIVKIEGFSAHADQKGLIEWVNAFKEKPKEIFLVHGEEAALDNLQRVIASDIGIQAIIPEVGSQYDLSMESISKIALIEQPSHVKTRSELNEAFVAIKEKIESMAKMPGKDTRTLQRLLAQVNEIEREMDKVG
jgi:metallo-beta-lactamase family protein